MAKHMGVLQPVEKSVQELIDHRLVVPPELKPREIKHEDKEDLEDELSDLTREVYFRDQGDSELKKKIEEIERLISERLKSGLDPIFEQQNENNSTLQHPEAESDRLKIYVYEKGEFAPELPGVLLEGIVLPVIQEYGQGQSSQSGGQESDEEDNHDDSDEEEDVPSGGQAESAGADNLPETGCQVNHQDLLARIRQVVDDPALAAAKGAKLATVGGALTGLLVSQGAKLSVRCAAVVSLALIYPAVFIVGHTIYFSRQQARKLKTEQVADLWSNAGGWHVQPLAGLQQFMKDFSDEHGQRRGFNLYRHLMAPLLIVMAYTQRMRFQHVEITREIFDKVSLELLNNPGSSSAEERQNEVRVAQISTQQQLAAQRWIVQNLPSQAWSLVAQLATSQLTLISLSGIRELEPGFYVFKDLIGIQMLTVSITLDAQNRRVYTFFRNPSFLFMSTYCAECIEGLISTIYEVHQKHNIQFTGSIIRLNAPDLHVNIFGPLPGSDDHQPDKDEPDAERDEREED